MDGMGWEGWAGTGWMDGGGDDGMRMIMDGSMDVMFLLFVQFYSLLGSAGRAEPLDFLIDGLLFAHRAHVLW